MNETRGSGDYKAIGTGWASRYYGGYYGGWGAGCCGDWNRAQRGRFIGSDPANQQQRAQQRSHDDNNTGHLEAEVDQVLLVEAGDQLVAVARASGIGSGGVDVGRQLLGGDEPPAPAGIGRGY